MPTDEPATPTEAARLRHENAALAAELEKVRYELERLRSRRSTRVVTALAGRRSAGIAAATKAAAAELRTPSRPPAPPVDPPEGHDIAPRLREARRARDAGDPAAALELVESLVADHGPDPELLALRLDLEERLHDPREAFDTASAYAALDPSPRLRARRRRWSGLLRSLDPRFAPLPVPGTLLAGDGPALVVHADATPAWAAPLVTGLASSGAVTTGLTDRLPDGYPRGGPRDIVLADAARGLRTTAHDLLPQVIVACADLQDPGPAIAAGAVAASGSVPFLLVLPDAEARDRLEELSAQALRRLGGEHPVVVGEDVDAALETVLARTVGGTV